ncbi:hypothetical protein [Asanoa iriomotensis]|uniref:Uncharacterized protein n=1 Tax=Asanoa iriomotensis TaxID=234613 RepID=A0ABQ4CGE9_9ACTN|nr:hypothetical protein [Asanoa iriomotensis]GIF61852.1 hypothetical protein Air01nite_79470 [Asanoa iriomotensis]
MIRSGVARTTRKTSRQILVRTLVVGGLAGAAWLLSASAAQAAAAEPAANQGLAPMGGVLEIATPVLSTATGLLGDVLTPATAHKPVEQPVPTGHATVRRAISDPAAVVVPRTTADRSITIADAAPAHLPNHAADRTADRAGVPAGPSNRSANRPATRVSGTAGTPGLVDPLGVTRALAVPGALITPVAQVALPVLAPVTALFRPMTSMLRTFAAPLFSAVGVVARTVTGALPGPRGRPTSAVTPVDQRGVHGRTSSGTTVPTAAHVAAVRAAHSETSTIRLPAGRPEPVASAATSRNTGEAPRLPYPAPTRGEGSASGIPASASGSPVGGGAFATVPSSVVGSMVAFQLLPKPADTAVPRHEAEKPTVSPD